MRARRHIAVFVALAALLLVLAVPAAAGPPANAGPPDGMPDAVAEHNRIVEFWTPQRRAEAIPRDLVIDEDGRGYLRLPNGTYQPYGNANATGAGQLRVESLNNGKGNGKGGGGGDDGGGGGGADTTPPVVTEMNPGADATIGSSYTFTAKVTDASGVKSVTFTIVYPNGTTTQSFAASHTGNDVWAVSLSGFSDGTWSWQVTAKDGARKGGNTGTTGPVSFTVETTSSEPEPPDDESGVVTNSPWEGGGTIQTAAGRIYFEMPANRSKKNWNGYVCSGTVADNGTEGRSIIITAAHCVYDDANKEFARNVLFIPNQAGTSGTGTDLDCTNDPLGCWTPYAGVVDANWANRSWPDNIPWDYAYYVVADEDAHTGGQGVDTALDLAAGSLPIQFTSPALGGYTHALGYSYSHDPKFMYCAEGLGTESSFNSWWLSKCELSGGASGGPWVQSEHVGSGPIVSVNSWGYRDQPGMAGPRLHGNTASCLFDRAEVTVANVIVTGSDCP